MTIINQNEPLDTVLGKTIPSYIRETRVAINLSDVRITDVETEISDARLGFENLKGFNQDISARLVSAENEITEGRGPYLNLNARFDANELVIEQVRNEVASARGGYATLTLRLYAADLDRADLWTAINQVIADMADFENDIDLIYIHFQLYYTKAEVDAIISQLSTDISEAMAAVVDGSAIEITELWTRDANGDIMEAASLPVFFSADPDVNLFQAGIGRTIIGRDDGEDLSLVTDPMYTLDGNDDIMPVTTLAPTTTLTTVAPTTLATTLAPTTAI